MAGRAEESAAPSVGRGRSQPPAQMQGRNHRASRLNRGEQRLADPVEHMLDIDVPTLTWLLRDDAVLEMPPQPIWFTGREQIGRFLQTHVLRQPGEFLLIPTAANGQPALAEYRGHGVHRAAAVQVLTLTAGRVAWVVVFHDPGLFAAFGLPPALPPAATASMPRR